MFIHVYPSIIRMFAIESAILEYPPHESPPPTDTQKIRRFSAGVESQIPRSPEREGSYPNVPKTCI